jgi:hypothetical protein
MDADSPAPAKTPGVEITAVEPAETGTSDALIRFALGQPVASTHHSGYDFLVTGWVLHPERRVRSVQVVAGSDVIGWGQVQMVRADVARAFPRIPHAQFSGFKFPSSVLGLPSTFESVVEATLDDGRCIQLARLRGNRSPLTVNDRGNLRPLLVATLGRSGSTFLMALLGGHPQIVTDRALTDDQRISSYWAHIFSVLSRPANHARGGNLSTFLNNRHFVGQNPFNTADRGEPEAVREWYGTTHVEHLAAFCRETVESFYRVLAGVNEQRSPQYFVEKSLGSALRSSWSELFPTAREIFLVRDFRDTLASILAFNAKRGYQAFGRDAFSSDEDYARQLGAWARELNEAWRGRAENSILVRYEDLVRSPRECLGGILAYLDLDAAPSMIDAMIARVDAIPALEAHRTANDGDSSIGRWRTDLDAGLQSVCLESFGGVLADFGYEVVAA